MKKLFRLFVAVLLLSGWALAASSLHIVRSPGTPQWFGRITLIPKDRLTFRQTYVDITHWTTADVAANPNLVQRIHQAGKDAVLHHVTDPAPVTPAPPPAVETAQPSAPGPAVASPQPQPRRSIFDE